MLFRSTAIDVIMEWFLLVIQLFFDGGEQQRAEVHVSSLDECIDLSREVFTIREYQGKPVRAISAGCHLTITDRPA